MTLTLNWVIAHEPAYLFYRVAADFKRLVNEQQDIQIDINILTAEEYNDIYNPTEPASRHNLWKLLQSNSVQIAQMQTTSLARQFNPQMNVLDMPYLFRDHAHAQTVLEGKIGTDILNQFANSSKLKGLAYTYSGGFRLMPMKHSVTTLAEIAGKPVRAGMSPIAQDTMRAFGLEPVATEIDEVTSSVMSGKVVGAEHVAQRLFPDQCDSWINTIIDTQHSLFLTSIVVNIDWWNSLPTNVQKIFMNAATEAARNERTLSIEDGEKSIRKLQDSGVTVIKLSDDEITGLKNSTSVVYDKYQSSFGAGFIDAIRQE